MSVPVLKQQLCGILGDFSSLCLKYRRSSVSGNSHPGRLCRVAFGLYGLVEFAALIHLTLREHEKLVSWGLPDQLPAFPAGFEEPGVLEKHDPFAKGDVSARSMKNLFPDRNGCSSRPPPDTERPL